MKLQASTYIFVLASDENHVTGGSTVRLDERGRVDSGAGFVAPAFGGCRNNGGINLLADLLAGCVRSARGASKEQYEEHHVLKGRVFVQRGVGTCKSEMNSLGGEGSYGEQQNSRCVTCRTRTRLGLGAISFLIGLLK